MEIYIRALHRQTKKKEHQNAVRANDTFNPLIINFVMVISKIR